MIQNKNNAPSGIREVLGVPKDPATAIVERSLLVINNTTYSQLQKVEYELALLSEMLKAVVSPRFNVQQVQPALECGNLEDLALHTEALSNRLLESANIIREQMARFVIE